MICQSLSVQSAPREDRRDSIDRHVGQRIKAKRILENMSQERLARALGISYQQLQRYESGKGRLPCSMLYRAAEAMAVPVGFFFEQMPGTSDAPTGRQPDKAALSAARNMQAIDPNVRESLMRLIDVLSKQERQAKAGK
jgi:transcriptional regulator with XRE-family HTH domain